MIEMMFVVGILGILAALAIPAFNDYMRRSKTSEVSANFNQMYKGFAGRWDRLEVDRGVTGQQRSHCVSDSIPFRPDDNPGSQKRQFGDDPSFKELGMNAGQYVYYSYAIQTGGAACDIGAHAAVATFQAIGDLDDDGLNSTFELVVWTDAEVELYHARGLYIVNELE